MSLNDPYEVIRPVKPQEKPKIDPRRLAWLQETQTAQAGQPVGKPQPGLMGRNVCRFIDGKHVYPGDNCPHGAGQQEQEAPAEAPVRWRRVNGW